MWTSFVYLLPLIINTYYHNKVPVHDTRIKLVLPQKQNCKLITGFECRVQE